ncbi:MAG: MBL fold metallo-hydrolase [Sulfitobacter sp.]|nr:MBL fold metallo-hydrolase [Sulfitobacter sp.]
MGEAAIESYRGLNYPFGRKIDLQPGEPIKIAEGVYWVRFPMPMSLDHINIWLLEDGDGWTVVDTCLNISSARETWEGLFNNILDGRPINRVICTHLHPDHVGLAGWLCERFSTELWMAREEFLMCRTMAADTGRPAPEVALRFYRAAGWKRLGRTTGEGLVRAGSVYQTSPKLIFAKPLQADFRRLLCSDQLKGRTEL